jgi:hypothetical protein
MAAAGVKTVAFIGFNDAYGDGWAKEFEPRGRREGDHDRGQPSATRGADTSARPGRC